MFILRIPFNIQSGAKLTDLDKEVIYLGLQYKLKKESDQYALIISPFTSPEAARQHFIRAWSGLTWILLHCGIAPRFDNKINIVEASDTPDELGQNLAKTFGIAQFEEVHGIFSATDTVIFESNKNFKTLSTGNVTLTFGASSDNLFARLKEGLELQNSAIAYTNDKFKLALDLYAAYFSESSDNSRFLTLVMALESLTEPHSRPKLLVDTLTDLQKIILEIEGSLDDGSEVKREFALFRQDLNHKKNQSIRSQIRTLVSSTLQERGEPDYLDAATRALKIYDARSELVHNGRVSSGDIHGFTNDAREIVERVLKAKLFQGH
jgi:hypothetical protein